MTEFGNVQPIVWNERSGNVVGGHQCLKVLIEQGEKKVHCTVVDIDEPHEKALNIALNKIQGEWDDDKLSALLAELDETAFDVSLTGFDENELKKIIGEYRAKDVVEDEFDVDTAEEQISEQGAVAKRGDVWLLGENRLMCGDSTDKDDFGKQMSGNHAKLCMTSPPYGVGKSYEKAGIEPWFETMKAVIDNIVNHADVVCWNIGDLLISGSQFIYPTFAYCIQMFEERGFKTLWNRIWNKRHQVLSSTAPYHLSSNKPVNQYENISAFAKDEDEDGKLDAQEFNWLSAFAANNYKYVKRLTNKERREFGYSGIWEINSVKANRQHPAMFPVELPWRCIKMHSGEGDIVFEPFSGSGTTLIACEQTNRICYAMELNPVYVDLAIARWEKFNGKQAVKTK